MLSIDEAIAREREVAEIHRDDIVPKEDYHNMPWIDMENEGNEKAAEEHEQLAEWLEELKALREEKSDFQIKQIAKKPTKDKYVPELDFCPECGTEVTNCNYCPYCGQKIKIVE